jgi:putative restriction endonuclease
MKYYIAVTDIDWFKCLKSLNPNEVNFWSPSAQSFNAIPPGSPFLFKLHYPNHYIVGGGFFLKYFKLSLSMAWDSFGLNNGVQNLESFREKINRYRSNKSINPEIGCTILVESFFLDEKDWLKVPQNWNTQIVRGKIYNSNEDINPETNALLDLINKQKDQIPTQDENLNDLKEIIDIPEKSDKLYLTKARLGQGVFRLWVAREYSNRCSMTGERTLPVLEAAHIKKYASSGPNRIDNGLFLRSDLHKLFDLHYITITRDFKIEVSKKINEEFNNGKIYYDLHGKTLLLPNNPLHFPSKKYIDYHNSKFNG